MKFTYSSFSDQKTFHFSFSLVAVTYIATDDEILYHASRLTSDQAECLHRSICVDIAFVQAQLYRPLMQFLEWLLLVDPILTDPLFGPKIMCIYNKLKGRIS